VISTFLILARLFPTKFEIIMKIFPAIPLLLLSAVSIAQVSSPSSPAQIALRDGWSLQTSAKVSDTGETISTPAFHPKDWLPVSIPSTVVAAQLKARLLPDPFFGMNLRQYPGVAYPIGFNFSNVPMPPDSPYAVSWWYRREFTLPPEFSGKTVWLNFRGINYRANIFLNGKQIADARNVAGAWRTYEFNETTAVKPGNNVLAVQVWAPTDESLAITFVDWNPAPPDKNMGLWRDVYLTSSGPVALRYPTVLSKVDSPANSSAHLTVTALVKNATDQTIKGTLKGRIEKIEFSQPVELAPGESKDVTFLPDQYPQLNISNPRLWWPVQMGVPNLYDVDLSFDVAGKLSDSTRTRFGIRQITSEVAEHAPNRFKLLFKVNGKNILIRGGGWATDMMLRENPQRIADEFR